MRLVAWNIENAARRLTELPSAFPALGDPDVLCLQELRIRAQDAADVAALERALPGYRCHHSLPRDPRNVTYRGGRAYGVATFVRIGSGPTASRALVPDWDREGRVVITRRPRLSIVNLYAVNGTSKPYFDETGAPRGDRHTFKREVQRRLFALADDLRAHGGVILAGDWNVSRTKLDTHPRLRTEEPHATARAELNAGLDAHGLVDIWRHLHPDERGYSWFAPWAKHRLDAARVDYIVVSADLVPRVRDAAILPRHPWSDHAPLSLDLA
ncbi:MAG TPA: exodeoxyribonuclease III [Kofleriaceae bacterium]|nr:exodeoxyribonuclease III [Kofleriaceae bacterium]